MGWTRSHYEAPVELRPDTMHMVHADRLKLCVTGSRVELFQFGTTPGDIEEENPAPQEWNVERILAHRFMRRSLGFLTKWEDVAPGEETC